MSPTRRIVSRSVHERAGIAPRWFTARMQHSRQRSVAMHQYKANALGAADQPYILEDYSILTRALMTFREKLRDDRVLKSFRSTTRPQFGVKWRSLGVP